MLFKPKQKKARLNVNLFINNHEITKVSEIVFWGVVLDQHLSCMETADCSSCK